VVTETPGQKATRLSKQILSALDGLPQSGATAIARGHLNEAIRWIRKSLGVL
jgi:hypothetical protein